MNQTKLDRKILLSDPDLLCRFCFVDSVVYTYVPSTVGKTNNLAEKYTRESKTNLPSPS